MKTLRALSYTIVKVLVLIPFDYLLFGGKGILTYQSGEIAKPKLAPGPVARTWTKSTAFLAESFRGGPTLALFGLIKRAILLPFDWLLFGGAGVLLYKRQEIAIPVVSTGSSDIIDTDEDFIQSIEDFDLDMPRYNPASGYQMMGAGLDAAGNMLGSSEDDWGTSQRSHGGF